MSKQLLKEYITILINEALDGVNKLRVFDFDDTLVKTHSRVHVKKANGDELWLTPAEYAIYDKEPGDEFDYSDFSNVINPEAIHWTQNILQKVISKRGPGAAVILTARGISAAPAIRDYLKDIGINDIEIITLGNSDPQLKADWIYEKAQSGEYSEIEFFDDSYKNIKAVKNLPEVPGVNIIARHIVH
jgi:hypothetical protein